MRISDLENKRVAIWGLGREGWSVLKAVRRAFPEQHLTVLDDNGVSPENAELLAHDQNIQVIDDDEQVIAALYLHDIVIKSPGISMYRDEVRYAKTRGIEFTSATDLWLNEPRGGTIVGITGTKGKSTTSSLLHHVLVKSGVDAVLGGNIGIPLFDLKGEHEVWIVELSSYQLTNLEAKLDLAVVLNLYPEHLDWHGTADRYFADKLAIVSNLSAAGTAILNAFDVRLLEIVSRISPAPRVKHFNHAGGVRSGPAGVLRANELLIPAADIPLLGTHNLSNIAAVLTAVEALNFDPREAATHVKSFQPLPHRLTRVAEKSGVLYVNDSISTIPQSALGALDALHGKPTTIILGGYDRGLDWGAFAAELLRASPNAIVTMPASGTVIANELRAAAGAGKVPLEEASDLEDAVRRAVRLTPAGGVVLLSPASPSYTYFANFEERGRVFSEIVARL